MKDFTKGNPFKLILLFALPVFFTGVGSTGPLILSLSGEGGGAKPL